MAAAAGVVVGGGGGAAVAIRTVFHGENCGSTLAEFNHHDLRPGLLDEPGNFFSTHTRDMDRADQIHGAVGVRGLGEKEKWSDKLSSFLLVLLFVLSFFFVLLLFFSFVLLFFLTGNTVTEAGKVISAEGSISIFASFSFHTHNRDTQQKRK